MFKSSPGMGRAYNRYSHGDHHLNCTYRLAINGVNYEYDRIIGNTGRIYDESHCEKITAEMPEHVRSITKQCTDIEGGAYYGFVFKRVK